MSESDSILLSFVIFSHEVFSLFFKNFIVILKQENKIPVKVTYIVVTVCYKSIISNNIVMNECLVFYYRRVDKRAQGEYTLKK